MAEKCKEVVTVKPADHEELKLPTHCGCAICSFHLKFPECVRVQSTGTCLCVTGAYSCGLKKFSEVTVCSDSHGSGMCLDLKECKEKGFKVAPLCRGSGRATSCFICESRNEFVCKFPDTCCKCACQECCIDCRCAVPMDAQVPCGCAICGKYFKEPASKPAPWGGDAPAAGGAVAPEQQQMA